MKKQGIVILGLLLCLAALGGGWYLLQDRGEAGTSGAESAAAAEAGGEDTDMTAKEAAGTVKETAGETPVASDAAEEERAAEEPDVLLDLPESGIARILVTNREGTVSAVPGAGGWTIEGLEGIPVDEAALHTLVTSASRLKSVHEIPDGASRPEEFGLTEEKASAEVEISLNDGSAVSLEVGDPVPGADLPSRYVKKDGRVHIVYATKAGVFLCGLKEFADRRVTPAYDSGTDNYVVESVTIAGTGFETSAVVPETASGDGEEMISGENAVEVRPLSVRRAETTELAGVLLNSYELTSPVSCPADASAMETWVYSFFNLEAEETAVIRPGEEEMRKYFEGGVWADIELSYDDGSGTMQTLSLEVSRPDAQGNAYAARTEAGSGGEKNRIPVIWRVNLADAAWASMGLQDLVSRQLLAPSVLTLSALRLEAEGKEPVTIRLEQDEENHTTQAYVGEELLEDRYFRNFYYTLISQTADEVLFGAEGLPEDAEKIAAVTFSYTGEDRPEDVLGYYRISDRKLYVTRNREDTAFTMSLTKWEQVWDTLEKLTAGEEVEARY